MVKEIVGYLKFLYRTGKSTVRFQHFPNRCFDVTHAHMLLANFVNECSSSAESANSRTPNLQRQAEPSIRFQRGRGVPELIVVLWI